MLQMDRDILQRLLDWKSASRRKPLVLGGARQVGKTWLLRELARREYANSAYLNFERDPALADLFEKTLDPRSLLDDLGLYLGRPIEPGTLLILDEIQVSNRALNSLKYFAEEEAGVDVAAAGSLLGLRISGDRSFPVGKVHLLDVSPMSFGEFLAAHGESGLRGMIQDAEEFVPFPAPLHDRLVDLLRLYLFVGGMPEAVSTHAETGDLEAVRERQSNIVRSYELDFAKYATPVDTPRLSIIWDGLPAQLAKENRRFVYSALRPGARARDYERALQWLRDAGLVHASHCVSKPGIPLASYARPSTFKIFAHDVGLLCAKARLPLSALVERDRPFTEFHGALVENYVAQELVANGESPLFYWKNERGLAEVDFVCLFEGRVFPLEVKAGINPRAKSLREFERKFSPTAVTRATLLNLREDGGVRNLPLYAVSEFRRLAAKRARPR